jgi:hypothetical protein
MVQPVQPVQLAAAQRRNGEGSCGRLCITSPLFKGIRSQGGIMALSLACLYRKTFKQNASGSLRLKEDISNDLFFQKLQRQR